MRLPIWVSIIMLGRCRQHFDHVLFFFLLLLFIFIIGHVLTCSLDQEVRRIRAEASKEFPRFKVSMDLELDYILCFLNLICSDCQEAAIVTFLDFFAIVIRLWQI